MAGTVNIHTIDSTTQIRIVTNSCDITNHYEFDPIEVYNDISLIKLEKPFSVDDYVKPIRLPPRSYEDIDFEGRPAIMSGWGQILDSSTNTITITNKLWFTSREIENHAACNAYYGSIGNGMICTRAGLCHGDSGGPLTIEERLLGISSYGPDSQCKNEGPDVYVRVSFYLDWIKNITGLPV